MTSRSTSIIFCLLIFVSLSATTILHAQDSEEQPIHTRHLFRGIHFEAGLNVVPLLRAAKGTTSDSLQLSPYWLNARLSWRNWGIRSSVGGTFSEKNTYVQGFKDSDKRTTTQFNLRAGLDYRINWKGRYTFTLGADWAHYFNENIRVLDSGFDVIEQISQKETQGGGVSVGGQWWISKHFGIGLESSFYFMRGELTEGRKFVNFPELNDDLQESDIQEIITPVALNAVWRF